MLRSSALASIFCSFLFLVGCGGSNVVAVSGTLTYKGKPVPYAFVNFVPESGRPSIGETDENGRFTLTYDPQTKGAQLGKHRVFVRINDAAMAGSQPGTVPGAKPKMGPEMQEFFSKYSGDKSKVEVTIDKATTDLKLDWD